MTINFGPTQPARATTTTHPTVGVNIDDLLREDTGRTFRINRTDFGVANPSLRRSPYKRNTFLKFKACLEKHERYTQGIRKLISTDTEMSGRVFGYRINQVERVGYCTVYGLTIAIISLETGLVLEVYLPKEEETLQKPINDVLNRTRLFLRRLGYSAKRYKNLTIIETPCCVKVLEQGETWRVPEYGTPYRFKEIKVKEWIQLPLIPITLYLDCEIIHENRKFEETLSKKIKEGNPSIYRTPNYYPSGGTGSSLTSSNFGNFQFNSSTPTRATFYNPIGVPGFSSGNSR